MLLFPHAIEAETQHLSVTRSNGLRYFEERQELLGHKSDGMTTHNSAPELSQLLRAANLVCERRPATVLRVVPPESGANSGKGVGQKDSDRSGSD